MSRRNVDAALKAADRRADRLEIRLAESRHVPGIRLVGRLFDRRAQIPQCLTRRVVVAANQGSFDRRGCATVFEQWPLALEPLERGFRIVAWPKSHSRPRILLRPQPDGCGARGKRAWGLGGLRVPSDLIDLAIVTTSVKSVGCR